jgi:integrase
LYGSGVLGKPLPLDEGLAGVLFNWRAHCPYNQDDDFVFASPDTKGQQPYWPTAGMEKHIRPAAERAGITKRIGWHTLRHTFGTLVKSLGADVATTKELMRHANVSITMDRYVQAVTPAKREAQRSVISLLAPRGTVMVKLTTASC